ncbi:glucose-6-phosphate dehydrogenase assembly protein OpcA [Saccharomonospora saliphila]|uniref:glucose-6-phosphate dehydrogenase assembly protein OpcA n=1 Tax=Saccharomonospora saliphila TaxID=369829 RepID=UPI000374876F|nr:glucose-6-phosphate dehydrogenase assembly protein OpcA [Saccharomonospora saliphila]
MIIDLPSTTTSQLNKKLVEIRERGGAVALGRVLTLVIAAEDDDQLEEAIDAANEASREHPSRVIVVAKGARTAAARIDGQIRVGGDAGASDVIVLRLYGPLANQGRSAVVPLLLPDAPIVTWWPGRGPKSPGRDQLGQLAQRRITDSAAEANPIRAIHDRARGYTDGDTDLAWTRLTNWRAQLVSALDLPPYEPVTSASVTGEGDSPSTELLAGWLAEYLKVPVRRIKTTEAQGIVSVTLDRPSGPIQLDRPDGKTGTLTQPHQPARRVGLQRRDTRDCLIEELRRLDPDEVYETSLHGLGKLASGKKSGTKSTGAKSAGAGSTGAKSSEDSDGKTARGKTSDRTSANGKATGTRKSTGSRATGAKSGGTKSSGGRATRGKAAGGKTSDGKATDGKTTGGAESDTEAADTQARSS